MSLTSNTKTTSMAWIHVRIKNCWDDQDIRLKPEKPSLELYEDYTAWCFFLLLMNESTDCINLLFGSFTICFIKLKSRVYLQGWIVLPFLYRDTLVVIRNEQT